MSDSLFDRLFAWHRLWAPLGLLKLNRFREQMRRENLHDTETLPSIPVPPYAQLPLDQTRVRTADGTYNDLSNPRMGSSGTRFGRNIRLDRLATDEATLLEPSPREISRRLMTRNEFQPAKSLNLLAAAWIQFEIHDWFSHGHNQKENPIEIQLRDDDDWAERPMTIRRSGRDSTRLAHTTKPPSFINTETHWWDGSQIYGSNLDIQRKVRSFEQGKLKLNSDGLLPLGDDGIDVTGVNGNWWLGLALLHLLFTLEHNAICDRLLQDKPSAPDEELFLRARLINAAVMAKIHTVEWTPAILGHPTVRAGMNQNWSRIRRSKAEHHAAPYSLTEEFVSVYRMHPLMPDDFSLRSMRTGELLEEVTFPALASQKARPLLENNRLADLFYSFGVAHPGAITLHNYPRFLQRLEREDGPTIDLAAVDILRDRERCVPRYNAFRQAFGMTRVERFEDLTGNSDWVEEIREVYNNDIDSVDLMVGMYAEPLIPGMGFSETAFRVFLLMASRRLQSDRFFTTDYNEETYTGAGLQWIEEANMSTVLKRHVPGLRSLNIDPINAFAPWHHPDH